MKLVMTLLVRDEADIIGSNIEFHLARGIDGIVAIDNGSRDGTREILDDYARAGVAVVFDEPGRDYAQSDWVTRAAHHARDALGADWIINNDADEFWVARDTTLREIAVAADARQLICPRLNMFCARDAPEETADWSVRMIHRVARPVPRRPLADIYRDPLPCPYFYLDLPPKAMVRADGLVRVDQGNHSAQFAVKADRATAPVEIFHFPVRSRAQFRKKIVQGGQAYAANAGLPETLGWHWRRWYRMYLEHGLEAALADALPETRRLAEDIRDGIVIEDRRFLDFRATVPDPIPCRK